MQQMDDEGRVSQAVHYAIPVVERDGSSRWQLACLPGVVDLHAVPGRPQPHLRSDDVRAVTCRNCLETDEYKHDAARLAAALQSRG